MKDQSIDPFHCHNGLIWQVCENLNELLSTWGSHRVKTTVVQILLTTSVECKDFREINVRLQKQFEVLNQMRDTWCCYRKPKFLLMPFHHFSDYLSVERGRQFTLEMTSTSHYSSRQAKYRILLQKTPSGVSFVLIRSCIMFFCSILFPSDKLHYLKLMTLGLGLQKVVLQILEFCQTGGRCQAIWNCS